MQKEIIIDLFESINYSLLMKQKQKIAGILSQKGVSMEEMKALEGVINLIDAFQDAAIDGANIDESRVYNLGEEDTEDADDLPDYVPESEYFDNARIGDSVYSLTRGPGRIKGIDHTWHDYPLAVEFPKLSFVITYNNRGFHNEDEYTQDLYWDKPVIISSDNSICSEIIMKDIWFDPKRTFVYLNKNQVYTPDIIPAKIVYQKAKEEEIPKDVEKEQWIEKMKQIIAEYEES